MAKERLKKVGILIAIILAILCSATCFLWAYIQVFGDVKYIDNTFYVDEITLADESDKTNVIEVKYFANDNNNGLEMFEINFNQFMDEDRNAFYSQGMQFVANTEADNIDFKFSQDENSGVEDVWLSHSYYFGSYSQLKNGEVYNYASGDGYKTTLTDYTTMGVDASFKITLGEDIYKMKMQGTDTDVAEAEHVSSGSFMWYSVDSYSYNDVYLLSRMIYEQIQSLDRGTNHSIVFKFGDMFDYYKYEDGVYSKEKFEDTSKIINTINNYYVIKVEVSADGAQKASESMFGKIKGSPTFNLNGDYSEDDYYIGLSEIVCTNNCFDKVKIVDNYVALKLSDDFVKCYSQYKEYIYLSVVIDLDALEDEGYEFAGFTADCGLSEFTVKTCKTVQTVDNVLTETEVAYA